MSNFHRLTVPSYFGGLPSGYDYINNATSGTPANANGVLTYGPNIGSYFIGFGDDATSADGNRPAQALAQNTDYLDNLMRSDLVQMARTPSSTVSGSPQTSVTITGTGNIWLGSGGYSFEDLFHVVDSNERDIEVSGTKVVVSAISAGGTLGGGFATANVTLTLNVGVPVGVTFYLYYCSRTNLATLPIDAMTVPFMRNSDAVDGSVVDFVAQISNPHALGNAVAGLQAYRFQGPDGVRLAKNDTMFFDCDPADSGALVRQFAWTTRELSVNRLVAGLYDDPTSTLFAGLTGILQTDTGVGFSTLGTFFMQDNNLRSGASTGMAMFWPLTSATSANGDQYPRLFEIAVTESAFGSTTPPSLLHYVNGRWCCTVGDGSLSFGDFSGATAIQTACAYATAVGATNLHIQVKRGLYQITTAIVTTANVVIEGVSDAQVVIEGAVTSGSAMFNPTGGHLILKSLELLYSSGTQFAIVGAAGTSLFMDEVNVVNLGIQMLNSATYNNIAAVYCRKCRFAPSTAGIIAVDLQFNDDNASLHNGYYFDECSWFCSDETQPCRIYAADSTHSATVSRVRFQTCSYTLGGTATTSSHLTHNTGVLEVNPNGGNGLLTVVDMLWVDCFPLSLSTAANAPLARIYSVALGDNVGANLAIIGRIEIRGGRWICNQSHATAISPVFIAAQEIVVDDVIFIANTLTSGGPSSEDTNILDGVSHSTADWAQFIFAPGAQTVSALSSDIRLCMRDVSFRQMRSASNSGDLWLFLGPQTNIDGITMTDYVAGGGGSNPNSRLRVTPPGIMPNPGSSLGSMRNITMIATPLGSGQYTAGAGIGTAGVVMLMPTAQSVTSEQPYLAIERLFLSGFEGTETDDGIVLPNASSYSSVGWAYALIDCQCFGATAGSPAAGLALYGHGTSGQGGNLMALDNFKLIRGVFTGYANGIILNPDYMGGVLLDGVRCKNNSGFGLSVIPASWQNTSRTQMLTVVNGQFCDNLGGNGQVQIMGHTAGDILYTIFKGNICTLNGSIDYARFAQGNGTVALPGTAVPGISFFLYGVHTGVAGSSSGVVDFVATGSMMENMALLKTP